MNAIRPQRLRGVTQKTGVCTDREGYVASVDANNNRTKQVSSRSHDKNPRDRDARRTTHARAAQDNHDAGGARYGSALPRGED